MKIVAYVPVIHRGYVELFRRYEGQELCVLGLSILEKFPHIIRDMRASSPLDVALMAQGLGIFSKVSVLEESNVPDIVSHEPLILPDEGVSRAFAEKFLENCSVQFENVFLRWHRAIVAKETEVQPDLVISRDDFDKKMLGEARASALRSSDWWRQVGAVAVRDKKILCRAYNKHLPSEHSPYVMGDPRSNFNAGERIDLSSALHAEIGIISWAAKSGVSLEGASLYVSTFPCPPCALAVASAGFSRVFYGDGYSLAGGSENLKSCGVALTRVLCEPHLS